MPYSKLHEAARAYALAGWPVFPITPGAKTPFPGSRGFKDATTDLTEIDAWWLVDPEANIGFCPETAGMCVVDEDTEKGGKYDTNEPETVTSPHGRHFYYSGSLPASASKIGPNIDTRGRGSYVLLPPSVVDGLVYTARDPGNFPIQNYDCNEVPTWIVDKLQTNAVVRARSEPIKTEATDRPQAIAMFKRYILKRLDQFVPGRSDDATYRAVARGRDLGLSDRRILQVVEALTGFDDEWIAEKIANVETYKQNEDGCDEPADYSKLAALVSAPPTGEEDRVQDEDPDAWVPHDPRRPADMPPLEYWW